MANLLFEERWCMAHFYVAIVLVAMLVGGFMSRLVYGFVLSDLMVTSLGVITFGFAAFFAREVAGFARELRLKKEAEAKE